jgi:hypothetical protein
MQYCSTLTRVSTAITVCKPLYKSLNGPTVQGTVTSRTTAKWTQVKVYVKLSLCFNWVPRHEDVLGEWRYRSTHSLTSALDIKVNYHHHHHHHFSSQIKQLNAPSRLQIPSSSIPWSYPSSFTCTIHSVPTMVTCHHSFSTHLSFRTFL